MLATPTPPVSSGRVASGAVCRDASRSARLRLKVRVTSRDGGGERGEGAGVGRVAAACAGAGSRRSPAHCGPRVRSAAHDSARAQRQGPGPTLRRALAVSATVRRDLSPVVLRPTSVAPRHTGCWPIARRRSPVL
ncbi:unnamed protein product, partial [Iphiclides podalirius]